jgi:hypothetical protein
MTDARSQAKNLIGSHPGEDTGSPTAARARGRVGRSRMPSRLQRRRLDGHCIGVPWREAMAAMMLAPSDPWMPSSSRLQAHTGGVSSFSPSGVKYHSFAFREEVAVQISARFTDTSSTSTATLASPGR